MCARGPRLPRAPPHVVCPMDRDGNPENDACHGVRRCLSTPGLKDQDQSPTQRDAVNEIRCQTPGESPSVHGLHDLVELGIREPLTERMRSKILRGISLCCCRVLRRLCVTSNDALRRSLNNGKRPSVTYARATRSAGSRTGGCQASGRCDSSDHGCALSYPATSRLTRLDEGIPRGAVARNRYRARGRDARRMAHGRSGVARSARDRRSSRPPLVAEPVARRPAPVAVSHSSGWKKFLTTYRATLRPIFDPSSCE